jgi:hypothetical protein
MIAISLALKRSQPPVSLYFWAHLIATPALFLGSRLLGNQAGLYDLLYVCVTLPILETSWFIACGPYWYTAMPSATLAALVGGIAASGLTGMTMASIIVLVEGILLCVIGWMMLLGMKEIQDRTAAIGIGVLSIALSVFDFGYLLHADWENANRWVPSFMGITSFLWIALNPSRASTLSRQLQHRPQ